MQLLTKKTYGLKHLGKQKDAISLDDVINVVENKIPANKNILRVINEDLSIRKGKYGSYIFYKTDKMKKPKFFKLKGFDQDELTCDLDVIESWIKATHLYM